MLLQALLVSLATNHNNCTREVQYIAEVGPGTEIVERVLSSFPVPDLCRFRAGPDSLVLPFRGLGLIVL